MLKFWGSQQGVFECTVISSNIGAGNAMLREASASCDEGNLVENK